MTTHSKLILGLAAFAVLLSACDNEKETDPPVELVKLQPKIDVKRVWSAGQKGEEHLRLGLRPVADETRLYAASHGGDVYAYDLVKGREAWRVRTKLELAGGPGIGAGHVVIGSSEGDVVAVRIETGKEAWRVRVGGEVISPPAVGSNIAVVRTVDGRLHGLNIADGSELWVSEQNVPRLTLRGTAPPVISGETVVCGFDNGKVLAVALQDGSTLWESAVAPSHGRTELERLVDIDSAVQIVGKDVFVVGFQGRAAMLALESSGQIWWSREISSERGLAVSSDAVYISTSAGDVVALRRRDGAPMWEQKALHRRGLTAPVLDGNTLVVADFEGYVHWLDAATGEVLARQKTDGERVTNAPVVANGRVYVLTDGGKLSAFQRTEPAQKQADAD